MRLFSLLWVVLPLSGCLYLGGINHAPEGEVELVPSPGTPARGEWVEFEVIDRDPDGDSLGRAWTVSLQEEGGPARGMLQSLEGLYEYGEGTAVVLSRDKSVRFLLPTGFAGSYRAEVRCTLTDPGGATHVAAKSLLVKNAAPEGQVVVTNGEEPSAGYPRHQTLGLSVAASLDEPDDLACGSGATVTWERLLPQETSIELWKVIPCRGGEILDKLLVRLAPSAEAENLRLRVTIKDRWGAERSVEFSARIAGSQAPCVVAMRPAAAVDAGAIGAVVMDGAPLTLSVVDSSPLSLEQLVFRWSSASQLAGPYADLPRQPGAHLALDTVALPPGERRFYRVRVEGGAGIAAPSCAAGEALCGQAALPAGCFRWVTWEVVGR